MHTTLICIILTFLPFLHIYAKVETSYNQFFEEASGAYDELLEVRRYLHQHAELRFKEFETSAYIQQKLKEYDVNFTAGWGANAINPTSDPPTGIIAEVGTGHSPCVAIRADIDALPIFELADIPFKSIHEGVMHACGHDAHTTMLLGAAKLLKKHESEIEGTIRFIFQPAEEGGSGAYMMLNEGVLTKYPPVDRITGLHIGQNFPTGLIACRPGTLQAGTYNFKVNVYGKGGHAATHHKAIDPLAATSAIVRALYDMYARERYFQHEEAGLISVTYIDAGSSAKNIIPDEAEFGGTIRALTKNTVGKMATRFKEIVTGIATAHQCTVKITEYEPLYPPNMVDPYLYDLLEKTVTDAGLNFKNIPPVMGAEDFAFFGEVVPAVFFRLGTGSGAEIEGHPPTDVPAHNAKFALDERVLPQGAAFHAYFAMQNIQDIHTNTESKAMDEF